MPRVRLPRCRLLRRAALLLHALSPLAQPGRWQSCALRRAVRLHGCAAAAACVSGVDVCCACPAFGVAWWRGACACLLGAHSIYGSGRFSGGSAHAHIPQPHAGDHAQLQLAAGTQALAIISKRVPAWCVVRVNKQERDMIDEKSYVLPLPRARLSRQHVEARYRCIAYSIRCVRMTRGIK